MDLLRTLPVGSVGEWSAITGGEQIAVLVAGRSGGPLFVVVVETTLSGPLFHTTRFGVDGVMHGHRTSRNFGEVRERLLVFVETDIWGVRTSESGDVAGHTSGTGAPAIGARLARSTR
ncbi:hypothetical protein [Cellulosimicrobium composti]|uniref:hypothetical protein n=1 Tax=Cellulosimicrobium composti TaxID=2672572 RepID=UPI0037932D01